MEAGNEVSRRARYIVFYGLALLLIAMGLVFAGSPWKIIEGYGKIIFHPGLLDFDAFHWAGHFGTGFANAGLLLGITLTLYALTGCNIKGVHIAAAMMVAGFSFYGKNILNIWFPMAGVLIYTLVKKKKISDMMPLMMFSTAVCPIFGALAFGTPQLGIGTPLSIVVGAATAILAGVMIAGLAGYLPQLHKGLVLYNAGFAAGIAATGVNVVLIALGLGREKYAYTPEQYVSGSNLSLGICLAVVMVYFIVAGIILGGMDQFKKLLKHRSKGGDYTETFGFGATLINMGFIGIVASLYVLATVKGEYCGPVYSCIYTAAGFAACGVTIRSVAPVFVGVYVTAFLTGGIAGVIGGGAFLASAIAKVSLRSMILTGVFSFGAAAVTAEYGWLAGLVVGIIHTVLVPNTGIFHGWASLYNNGYSISLITVLAFPLYSSLKKFVKQPDTMEAKVSSES